MYAHRVGNRPHLSLGAGNPVGSKDSTTGAAICCLPRHTLAESWNYELELGTDAENTLDMGYMCPNQVLTAVTNAYPYIHF